MLYSVARDGFTCRKLGTGSHGDECLQCVRGLKANYSIILTMVHHFKQGKVLIVRKLFHDVGYVPDPDWEVRQIFREMARLKGHPFPEEDELDADDEDECDEEQEEEDAEEDAEEEDEEQEEDIDGEEYGHEGENKGDEEMDDDDEVEVLSAHPGSSGPTPAELHDAIRSSPTAASSGLDDKRRELYEKMYMIKELENELGATPIPIEDSPPQKPRRSSTFKHPDHQDAELLIDTQTYDAAEILCGLPSSKSKGILETPPAGKNASEIDDTPPPKAKNVPEITPPKVDPSAVTPDMQAKLRDSLKGRKKKLRLENDEPAANDEPAHAEPAGKKTKKKKANDESAKAAAAADGPDEAPMPVKRGRATSNLTVNDDVATSVKKAKGSKNPRAETTNAEESGHKRTPRTCVPTRPPSPPAHGGCSKCRHRRNGCRKCNPAHFADRARIRAAKAYCTDVKEYWVDTKTTGEITRTMSETTIRRFEVRDVEMPLPAPLVGKSPQPFLPDDEEAYYEDQEEGSEEEEGKEEGTDSKSKQSKALRKRKEKDARNAATEAEEDELVDMSTVANTLKEILKNQNRAMVLVDQVKDTVQKDNGETTKLEQHANKLMTLHDEIADIKANFTVKKDQELPGSTKQMQAKFFDCALNLIS
ncbi:unnamed protein product [Symbiodinium sp. CCMP2592]|nr:unnamed protein product [Symbiodinium sp. CCMP2592]